MGGCGWVKVAKAKAKRPSILRENQAPRKEKAQARAAKNGKASDALLTRPHLPVSAPLRLDLQRSILVMRAVVFLE